MQAPNRPPPALRWAPLAPWAVAWALMFALDGRVDLGNQALLLVLAAALSAIWWSPLAGGVAIVAGVLAFNVAFVPPRGTLSVDVRQHALLLLTMLTVGGIVTVLTARLRRAAAEAAAHARRAEALRRFADTLREADPARAGEAALCEALAGLSGLPAALLLAAPADEPGTERVAGAPSLDETEGLRLCAREGRAFGPGTGRHDEQPGWYLPLRGPRRTHGAALVRLHPHALPAEADRAHAQALCDQFGQSLERAAAEHAAARAREQAQLQSLRNTLLSAVAHDHRTPLATIVSAAGALHDQADRLDVAQRRRLAATVVDEATQLARITDNTLQLARLDAVGPDLARDWESLEELVGSVMQRMRQREGGQRLRAQVAPGLPLLRCDAVLIVRLIENLVDNALRHGGAQGPVELCARQEGERLLLAVRDRGPGVPPEWVPRIFDAFTRGPGAAARGTGVGLALCRAIARVHGGELRVRARRGGGSSFELSLPLEPPPGRPADETAAPGAPPAEKS